MAFMEPDYTQEPFVLITDSNGEDVLVPLDVEAEWLKEGGEVTERFDGKWFARLSAPGYMDCTDWSGPFDSLEDAKAHIEDMYEVDPETGDDLE